MNERPFVFGVAATGDNFTDRERETTRLLNNFRHGVNSILISPRRWGKTSLVKEVADMAQSDKLKVVYLDIFSCRSDKEFFDAFATSVIRQTSSKFEELMENAKMFLSRISPKISFGPDPMNEFAISLDFVADDLSVNEILNLPEKICKEKGIKMVICIDEFQQIGEFKDSKTFQKKLRTVWQMQNDVSYCLFGNKRHLMNEIFESRSHPFYKFGDAIYLPKIPTDYWVEYITERFAKSGKSISADLAAQICALVSNHSSYVQQLAWLVWIHTDKIADDKALNEGLEDLIAQNTALFERQTENLSAYQMNLLQALVDGHTEGFTTDEMLQKYQLGSSANVAVIKKALVRQELVETEGKKMYLSDPVMAIWFKRINIS